MAGSPYVPTRRSTDPRTSSASQVSPPTPIRRPGACSRTASFLPPALTPVRAARRVRGLARASCPSSTRTRTSSTRAQEGFWPYVTNTSHSWQAIYEMDDVRYMLHYGGGNRWNVYDITDPRDLKLVDEETLPWTGPGFGAVTIEFNAAPGQAHRDPGERDAALLPQGPGRQQAHRPDRRAAAAGVGGPARLPGVRGQRPHAARLDARWREVSTDPNHGPDEIQEGNGVLDLPVYYGGDYLFVASAPDNTFTNQPYKTTLWAAGHIAYDVSDPSHPRRLSTLVGRGLTQGRGGHLRPTSRTNPRWDNKTSWFGSRMGLFLPRSVESGWKYGYAAQGGQGFFVLDISDPVEHAPGGLVPAARERRRDRGRQRRHHPGGGDRLSSTCRATP